jgi:DMSO/TMAO reductase YedYZ molybdopterin-dependent catalytic subunit
VGTRGFFGRRQPPEVAKRIPPGQHLIDDFPVLTAGPHPKISAQDWTFTLKAGPKPIKTWTWDAFNALPQTKITRDIHCVTTWTKFDTEWEGVSFDDILLDANVEPPTAFVLAPTSELLAGKAMVALKYDGQPLPADHGGPARLVVPHLYFWKSAKWISAIQFTTRDEAGFWELRGYHMYGDPWAEQRFTGD